MKRSDAENAACDTVCVHPKAVNAAKKRLPDDAGAEAAAAFYGMFADPSRYRLLSALAAGELCVCDLSACLDMTQSAVSHQLARLKLARLVKARRDGKSVYYSLDDDHVLSILELANAHLSERGNP